MLCGHKWDGSLFLDFCTINHDEINRVLLVVFNIFIITFLIIVQRLTISVFTVPLTQCSQVLILHSSQVHPISWMELLSWTAPYLDTIFTPPVYKTCIFHQDFSSRDSLMPTVKVNTLKLSINYDRLLSPYSIGGHQSFTI